MLMFGKVNGVITQHIRGLFAEEVIDRADQEIVAHVANQDELSVAAGAGLIVMIHLGPKENQY